MTTNAIVLNSVSLFCFSPHNKTIYTLLGSYLPLQMALPRLVNALRYLLGGMFCVSCCFIHKNVTPSKFNIKQVPGDKLQMVSMYIYHFNLSPRVLFCSILFDKKIIVIFLICGNITEKYLDNSTYIVLGKFIDLSLFIYWCIHCLVRSVMHSRTGTVLEYRLWCTRGVIL